LGGCRAHSPLPAHPRHAKPPHHRPAPGEPRRAAAYRIQLDGGLIFTCSERRLRLHRAGKARQSARRERAPAFDSHHGAPRTSYHRACVAASGANSAVNPGACRRSKQTRHAPKTRIWTQFPLKEFCIGGELDWQRNRLIEEIDKLNDRGRRRLALAHEVSGHSAALIARRLDRRERT
jgi:hypothetical protein